LIASRWHIDPARSAFFGYSYGGLFAMWLAMQKHPRFPLVCAGSPGVMVDNSKVYDVLRQQRESKADHSGRHLHMTICEAEIREPTIYQLLSRNFARLLQELGSAPLPGLKLTSHIVPHETHVSGMPISWYSFLRSGFPAKRAA
jgi:predicted alpha/beta superfamily hydrolase